MPHDPSRRLRQLQRVLIVIELLGPLRYGATINELISEVRHADGEFCTRTIERDLDALQQLGLVQRERLGHRLKLDRWKLTAYSSRASRLNEIAEHRAEWMVG
ncbi:hypothetical protein [Rhodopirellula europaea]